MKGDLHREHTHKQVLQEVCFACACTRVRACVRECCLPFASHSLALLSLLDLLLPQRRLVMMMICQQIPRYNCPNDLECCRRQREREREKS